VEHFGIDFHDYDDHPIAVVDLDLFVATAVRFGDASPIPPLPTAVRLAH
jgi:hypothetical protein